MANTTLENALDTISREIKHLKSNMLSEIAQGNMEQSSQWIEKLNTYIRELDHLVEALESKQNS